MSNITIGIDLGDKNNVDCVINADGKPVKSVTIENIEDALRSFLRHLKTHR